MSIPEASVQISEPTLDGDELSAIDHEEQAAGYQAAYTKLAASEVSNTDPVAYVPDTVSYIRSQLVKARNDPRVQAQLSVAESQTSLVGELLKDK